MTSRDLKLICFIYTPMLLCMVGTIGIAISMIADIVNAPPPTCKPASIQVADIMPIHHKHGPTYAIASTNGTLYSFNGRSMDFQKGKCFLISVCSGPLDPGPYISNHVERQCP